MMRHALAVAMVGVLIPGSLAVSGCHADDDDPKGQAEELDDPVRREHAISRLTSIFSARMVLAKGDRKAKSLKDFADQTHAQLVKTYIAHPEDAQNGLRVLSLLQEMRDPRALPALLEALKWRAEVTEDHAVTAARTMTKIGIPDAKKAEVVTKICEALKRVDGARGVDNRMRKSFIEVLGKLGDKGATATLVEIATNQEESQNFLFNILAAQQLVKLADPESIPAMLEALYLFSPSNPAMRMNDVATSVLVAIGKPALEPTLALLRGENEDAKAVIKLYLTAIKRKDQAAAAKMDPTAILSAEATYALGKLGHRDALDALVGETKSEDAVRRFGGALAMVSINRLDSDTRRIMDAIKVVYKKADRQQRPQLLVAVRHLYGDEVMPFLLKVAADRDAGLPVINLYAFAGHALLANKADAAKLKPILEAEELFKTQLEEYMPAIALAEECDESIECYVGKLNSTDKIVLRKVANSLARFGRGDDKAIEGLIKLFSHRDLEVRNEALSAVDYMATKGSQAAIDKIDELEVAEGGRSIWNNFKREALPTRSRLSHRGG